MNITVTISDELHARLIRIAEIAGTSLDHIAESGIEQAVAELEAYHEVDEA